MSSISITRLYDLLSAKVGKETAETLTSFIEERVKEEFDNKVEVWATKRDISDVKEEIARLENKISETKTELIKWMFIFWIGQLAATFGFILLFLKK